MTILYILIAIVILLLIGMAVIIRKANRNTPDTPPADIAADCCGAHAVCERDSLLSQTDQIIYFDDEELDTIAGIQPDQLTPEQITQLEDIFYSLREQDISGWLRSLQLRNITLPDDLREQALLIISERRQHTLDTWNKTHNHKDQ